MLGVYEQVTAQGQPNFWVARIPLPSNFNFHEWEAIAHSEAAREVIQFVRFGSPIGFESPIATYSSGNHHSATLHHWDVGTYIKKETSEGAMLGPFHHPPFTLWCQTSPLLTCPKWNFTDRRVIMDLSWPLTPQVSVNSGTPRESFLGCYKKMHLPSLQDLCDLICKASKGPFLYSADVARAYIQLPMDPDDWPLVCFRFQGAYYSDISLPFGLC